ncbi:MAG TPA: DUF5522 domain-containing protein [Pyrinomonadaceae bacterium]|nr:DUF5522 domain-containing protein [Pyrinomonadaceae bacterium]
MKEEKKVKSVENQERFIEGVDYYFENGLMILTRHFLLKRGYCCRNGCRNCPYTLAEEEIYNKKVSSSSL